MRGRAVDRPARRTACLDDLRGRRAADKDQGRLHRPFPPYCLRGVIAEWEFSAAKTEAASRHASSSCTSASGSCTSDGKGVCRFAATDWLLARQGAIQKKLATRHLSAGRPGAVRPIVELLRGSTCPLARIQGQLQLDLFDERNLLELSSPDYAGERLVACRNPELANLRTHKREELLAATEHTLQKIKARVDAGKLVGRDEIGLPVGKVINQYKVAKHFELTIGDNTFTFARKSGIGRHLHHPHTIVARHAGEMINEITLAMVAGIGLGTLARVIHAYPTQAEAIKKAADAYNRTASDAYDPIAAAALVAVVTHNEENGMNLGMIGLGRMGANMALRLMRGGHRLVGFDPNPEARKDFEDKGGESADSLAALVAKLPAPRTLWLMVPAGEITESTLTNLLPLLAAGDTVIDGGNSNYKDTMRRAGCLPLTKSTSSTAAPAVACGAWPRASA